jgi:hypothetical protein
VKGNQQMDRSQRVGIVDLSADTDAEGVLELRETSLTKRDCFSVAAQTLLRCDLDARLVHGWVRNKCNDGPKYVRHAWVETTGIGSYRDGTERPITIVIDDTLDEHDRTLPRTLYYDTMVVRPLPKRYTFSRMALLSAIHEDYGPWDDERGDA